MTRLQLSSIDRMPRAVPVWDAIISDLGNPPPERIAKALHVGRSTAYPGPHAAGAAGAWHTRRPGVTPRSGRIAPRVAGSGSRDTGP